jgi:ATP-dependent Clp protease ATP-binding subunit ClpC
MARTTRPSPTCTDRARGVVDLAQDEARARNDTAVGTEHILLAITGEGDSGAVKVLESMEISRDTVREVILETTSPGHAEPASGAIPLTPQAKTVYELASEEAAGLGDDYVGTEHILLGLVREGKGVAAQVLEQLGADLHRVHEQVVEVLHGQPEPG